MDRHAARAQLVSPGCFFVLVAGACGVLLALISPPLRWGDENTHFPQAYRVAELDFVPTVADGKVTASLPRGVGKLMLVLALERHATPGALESAAALANKRAITASHDDRRTVELISASYPPLSYVPQALGIALARVFTRSVLLQLYAARLTNLATWIVLVWTAIRTTPLFKLAFAVLALTPMSIFLAGSCAVDPLANGLAFLWSAWVIRLAVTQRPSFATLVLLGVLAAALALVKLVYAPLVLLLGVPADRFGGWRARLGVSATILGTSTLVVAAWVVLARSAIAATIAYGGEAALGANRALLIHDPTAVARLMAETVLNQGRAWVFQLTDTHWGSPMAPAHLLWIWLAAVLAATCAERRAVRWPARAQRGVALVAVLLAFASVMLCAFLFWSPSTAEIAGIQGRYAIPLLPAFLIACCPPSSLRAPHGWRTLLRAAVLAILVDTVYRGTQLYR